MSAPAIMSFRGVWWLDDSPAYGGPRFDGELWKFSDIGKVFPPKLRGICERFRRGQYDAVEVRIEGGQFVRYRRREATS